MPYNTANSHGFRYKSLTVDHINVEAALKTVQQLLAEEENVSSALRATLEVMIMRVQIMANRLSLTSRNSSKPPSTDRFKDQDSDESSKSDKKKQPGGQPGRIGTTLQKIDEPDAIEILEVDPSLLPPGTYQEIGFEVRQVFDIDIHRLVTEYRAQVLEDPFGKRYTAPFPISVTKAVQYGNGVKAQAVYLSHYQLIPYQRVQEHNRKPIEIAD